MDQAELVGTIDEALERFSSRDMVPAAEICDWLLDVRLALLAAPDDALARLLEEESAPTAG